MDTNVKPTEEEKKALRLRVNRLYPYLPKDYIDRVVNLLPHLNNYAGRNRITRTYMLVAVDETITEALEQIVKDIKSQLSQFEI
jgi:hypothetical protein